MVESEPEHEVRGAFAAGQLARMEQPLASSEGRCVSPPLGCGQPLAKPLSRAFRDLSSKAEYGITGLCQSCQDALWDACITEEDIEEWEESSEYERCPDCGRYCP